MCLLRPTPQITGAKKQSEAALFGVRVNLPCYVVLNMHCAYKSHYMYPCLDAHQKEQGFAQKRNPPAGDTREHKAELHLGVWDPTPWTPKSVPGPRCAGVQGGFKCTRGFNPHSKVVRPFISPKRHQRVGPFF